jgi:hypothetical protein
MGKGQGWQEEVGRIQSFRLLFSRIGTIAILIRALRFAIPHTSVIRG